MVRPVTGGGEVVRPRVLNMTFAQPASLRAGTVAVDLQCLHALIVAPAWN
jgi:hypothetical protein